MKPHLLKGSRGGYKSLLAWLVGTSLLVGALNPVGATLSGETRNQGSTVGIRVADINARGAGEAVLNLSNVVSQSVGVWCVPVTYTGSAPSGVRVYGTISNLPASARLSITRGSSVDSSSTSCSGFTPSGTTYLAGQPSGVVYSGTLGSLGTNASSGVNDGSVWSSGMTVVYQISIKCPDIPDGSTGGSLAMSWEVV